MWTLTDDQLLLLDGTGDDKMQSHINSIKFARSQGETLPLIPKILSRAQEAGYIKILRTHGRFCPVCGKSAGYALHTRSGRWHRKGDKNYDRPLTMPGIEFETSCVHVKDSIDCCSDCDKANSICEKLIDLIVTNKLPIELRNNPRNLFIKDDARECFSCKETIYESDMGRSKTLMGNGSYPSTCPKCGAESKPLFGPSHKVTMGFRLLEVPPPATSEGE